MEEVLRGLYIALAGIEFGFLVSLAYYRFIEARVTGDRGIYGLTCLAVSFMLFIAATVIGSIEHFNYITIPFGIVFVALIVLMLGTYLINTSELGAQHFFSKPPCNDCDDTEN